MKILCGNLELTKGQVQKIVKRVAQSELNVA
jgi:hypothetical protein